MEDASRIIIETYLRPLWCGTVPLTTSDAFPVIIVRSQCHLKETPALFSPHGPDIKSRLNEGLGARRRMGNSRTTTGVNVRAASWPHMGAIGASKGQLPLRRDAATCVLLLLDRTVVAHH